MCYCICSCYNYAEVAICIGAIFLEKFILCSSALDRKAYEIWGETMAFIVLEDGSVYSGLPFESSKGRQCDSRAGCEGCNGCVVGEVVFNTGMTGYEELLSDPSYCGQIVVLTYPLVGNYGISGKDAESSSVQVKALAVSELCDSPSNWLCSLSLKGHLAAGGICGIKGIDTRALTRELREQGTMRGALCPGTFTEEKKAQAVCKALQFDIGKPVDLVTCNEKHTLAPDEGKAKKRVAVLDFGLKLGMVRGLQKRSCEVVVYPAHTGAKEILNGGFDGVLLTNGPGDPKVNVNIIKTVKELLDSKKPIFGICLGFQLLALACDGDTAKLKYGHRGCNHPVKDLLTGRVTITSQNHGYAVLSDSLPENVEVTHLNWNDKTVEGLRFLDRPAFGVQYHPEANPGPKDAAYLFDQFVDMMEQGGEQHA